MTGPEVDGITPGLKVRRRKIVREGRAACRDCRYTRTGPMALAKAAAHAKTAGHLVSGVYHAEYEYLGDS